MADRGRKASFIAKGEIATSGEIGTAYGLLINIDGPSERIIADALMAPADKTVEVAVKYRGATKEYTLTDFFKRLGFY